MAVTLHTTPINPITLISNSISFEFSMTGVDSGNTSRRLGYQLFDSNGPISAIESITPQEGKKFTIEFNLDIKPLLYTKVPQICGSRGEPEMVKQISLKYWEFVFDKSECVTSIENTAQTIFYRILNSAIQYWGKDPVNYIKLTDYPKIMKLCRKSCQLYYAWSDSSNAKIKVYQNNNTFWFERSVGIATASSFSINPTALAQFITGSTQVMNFPTVEGNLNNIKYIAIEIDDDEVTRFYLEDCCCFTRLAYQMSSGGYSYMFFDCEERFSIQSTSNEICLYQSPNKAYSEQTRTLGGLTSSEVESFKWVTLTKVLDEDDLEHLRLYEDFLSSGSYYYEYEDIDGNKELIKFLKPSGSITYYEKDKVYKLTIRGKINQPHQMPSYLK